MKSLRLVGLILILCICTTKGFSQQSLVYKDIDADFKTGVELFQKEKYNAAQKSFVKVIEKYRDPEALVRVDAEYYKAICAIELFNKDGEFYLKQFVRDHPENPKVKSAYLYLGRYNYRKKKWREALDWFAKVDVYDLTNAELSEFYFKRGYSNFVLNKYPEAKKDFYELKDVDNSYATPSKYYYAHILYSEGNYETALADFSKLQKDENFGPVVPYYIAQIYYLQGRYTEVIAYVPELLDSAVSKRVPELSKVLGEAYYRKGKFKEALPYLKKYEKTAKVLQRSENFMLGYTLYSLKDYDDAVNYLIKTTNIDDSLGQNAYYHIGDCYIKLDNKQNARNAFGQAAKIELDKSIQEDALFNYAKLSYELAFNPYGDAIKAFQQYLKKYPAGNHADEAYMYLVNMFLTSKDNKAALEAIDNVKTLTPELKQMYQKIAYYRGIDLFNSAEYEKASKLFDKSLSYNFDKNVRASAIYWKAESNYRIKQYDRAVDLYMAYVAEPGAISKSEFSDANYNIGYAYFKMSDYSNSVLWFRKFITFKTQADPKKVNDAYNRIGDGYFMNKDFANAVDYYSQSYKMHKMNADYALFQRALANGVMKKYGEKISDLKAFIAAYSTTSSTYVPRAKFELASTYLVSNQPDMALNSFNKFIEEYPNSPYVSTALSKIGLIYYNKNDDKNALATFDKLIKRDRKSADAVEAIEISKKIYSTKGDVEGLGTWMSSIGESIPQAALDSISYNVGRNHYLEQDYKNAVTDFDKYTQKFPDGIFITEANMYRAEGNYKLGNNDAALTSYAAVIGKNKNEFTEQALSVASELAYKKPNYTLALDYYKQLEQLAENPKNNAAAKIGIMRTDFELKDYNGAIEYAGKVINLEKPGNDLLNEAHAITAKSYLGLNKVEEALIEFKTVASNSKNESGAEASYSIANIHYTRGDYKQSQKVIFDFFKNGGDYPMWIDKSLLLLADNYAALKDNFQAKTTLQSIIDDSKNAESVKTAKAKLAAIIAAEEAEKASKVVPAEPVQIQFDGNTNEQKKLFTEPVKTEEGEKKHE
ncbi:MAG TPA: tetratricopeptide repeat protein [Bacteroidia bacterium]|nr:tetratricopeptide repeat protein [Bacteroidia bacterium]